MTRSTARCENGHCNISMLGPSLGDTLGVEPGSETTSAEEFPALKGSDAWHEMTRMNLIAIKDEIIVM